MHNNTFSLFEETKTKYGMSIDGYIDTLIIENTIIYRNTRTCNCTEKKFGKLQWVTLGCVRATASVFVCWQH